MMRRLILALFLLPLLGVAGCFTTDSEHNRSILKAWRTDLKHMHWDIDRALCLGEESPLYDRERY